MRKIAYRVSIMSVQTMVTVVVVTAVVAHLVMRRLKKGPFDDVVFDETSD